MTTRVLFRIFHTARFKRRFAFARPPLLIVFLVTGCRVVQNTAELPGKTVGFVTQGGRAKPAALDPVEVQQAVLRFADEFAGGVVVGVDKLRRGTNALDPAETLQWKIALDTKICSIASGPNAYANLLDLTVLVSATRGVLEDHWQPKAFGDSAQAMVESCRSVETNLWLFVGKVLTPAEQAELREAIQNWRRQNPEPESVLAARAVGFASQVPDPTNTDPAKPGTLINLLTLDPLAGMDPAVREIAQSRLFAERALYVTQKMPTLVRWQTELLSLNAVRMPAVQQLVTNSTLITSSAETFARVADQLPKLVNDQREAAIKQVFDGLAAERTNLIASLAANDTKLDARLVQLRQTLNAATELIQSSDTTIKTLDQFLVRFDKGTNLPDAVVTNSRPFDILDYATTAKEMTTTIKQLNEMLDSLDIAVPHIQKSAETFESAGNRLLARLFCLGAGLIVLFFLGALLLGTAYWRLSRKRSASAVDSLTRGPADRESTKPRI